MKPRNIGLPAIHTRINGVFRKNLLVEEDLLEIRDIELKREPKKDRSKPVYYVYNSVCQLLNNLLEMQDSQLEMSRNPLLLGDVLSAEEHVLGCMCDLFRSIYFHLVFWLNLFDSSILNHILPFDD